jgi:predicted GTPase
LRTYIEGPTLTKVLKNNSQFFSGNETVYRNALITLIKLLIDSEHYFHDMKCANLIFERDRWQVIDSGKADDQKNRSDTVHEYRENLREKWSRNLSSHEIRYLESFLDKYCI